jgi:hypothetical protein
MITAERQADVGWVYCTNCKGTKFYIALNLEDTGVVVGEDQYECRDPIKGVVCANCKQAFITIGNAWLAGPVEFKGEIPPDVRGESR